MATLDQALAIQISNIQAKTGKSLDELAALLKATGREKNGELRSYAQEAVCLGYGDTNTLVHVAKRSDGASQADDRGLSADDVVAEIYTGPKAALRPIHDAATAAIWEWGDFEVAPKRAT